MGNSDNISVEFLQKRLAALTTERVEASKRSSDGDGSGSTPMDGNERIGRLEGAIEGLRHSQNLMLGAIGFAAAILIGLAIYSLQRLDALDDQVSKLPNEISSQLRDITSTLSEAITATKQTPPQVIFMPPPGAPPDQVNDPKP